ncbi:hypothetical protein CCUS01_03087 [Colletotrichum cuscutae]|uniref:Uncharacterized protein n=1 Tax=Colletotrichum cuscutae TaxID=1209917 RepID=A0AAJ0DLA8_9PEZI|nr:hypothetical protein CCUS01_03087 [Colletotrichum cuscutae]
MSHRQHSHNVSTSSADTICVEQPTSPFIPESDKRQSLGSYKAYQSTFVSVDDVSPSEPALSSNGESRRSVPSRWSRISEKSHIKSETFSPSGSWTFKIWHLSIEWIHFKTRREPLSDMEEVFDDASRGTWGALMMLIKLRGGLLGSFGAFVAILTLAFSPFAQQIATFHARTTNTTKGAINLRAEEYLIALSSQTASEGFIPILPFKAAVYNGLFAENGKPWLSLPVNCQTGNCTWEPFETLGVCNTCVDMSEFMTRSCEDGSISEGDMTECGWSVPVGARLKTHADVFSITPIFPQGLGDMSYSTIMKLIFMGTERQGGVAGALAPWARQCTLQACVQTLDSEIINGELEETIHYPYQHQRFLRHSNSRHP